MTAETNVPYVTNLVNSIIGVSVLAMPYCMKKCGLLLGLGLLIGISWLTYISCNMLITAAAAKRRRSYEYLAFYTVGPTGKLAVELSMIGLMLGTCVAFYVIIGDLATAILEGLVEAESIQLRTFVIVFCALCVALPLGLMKNLSILGFIGFISLIFYCIFVCVMLANSISTGFLKFRWMEKIELFRPAGIFQCLPIFSLAYACQCQLFVVYDSLEDASVLRMETIVAHALKIVTTVYCLVAILGYTTYIEIVEGNVLKNFSPNLVLDLIKFGFAISVVVGFPLMIFPCRQSIHTLFFSKHPAEGVSTKTFIEPFTFKAITLCIVLSTMMVAIFIPNVETILGLTGATMGSFICFIFPGIIFSKASPKGNTSISKFVLGVGCILLVLCTYSNVYSTAEDSNAAVKHPIPDVVQPVLPNDNKQPEALVKSKEDAKEAAKPPVAEVVDYDHRHEPANPVEPVILDNNKNANLNKENGEIKTENKDLNDDGQHLKSPGHEVEGNGDDEEKKDEQKNIVLDEKGAGESKHNADANVEQPADEQGANAKVDRDNINQPSDDNSDAINEHPKLDMAKVNNKPISSKQKGSLEKENFDHKKDDSEHKVENPNVIVSEEKLLHIIKEHHKEQHKLLSVQEELIQALEKQHDVHKAINEGETSHKLNSGPDEKIRKDVPIESLEHDVFHQSEVKYQVNQQQFIQPAKSQQVNQPIVQQLQGNQPVVQQQQVNQPIVQQQVNQPVAQHQQVNQPVGQQQQVNQPVGLQQQVNQVVGQQQQVNQVVAQQPQLNQPIGQQPQLNQLVGQQPLVNQPVVHQPQGYQPVAQQQQGNQPVGQLPQVNQVVAQQPQLNQPIGQQPQVNQLVGQQPQINQPIGQQPPVNQLVVQQQQGNQPVAQQQQVHQPVVQQQQVNQLIGQQPQVNQAVAQQPQLDKPIGQQQQVNQLVDQQPHANKAVNARNGRQLVNPVKKLEKKLEILNRGARKVFDNDANVIERASDLGDSHQPNFDNNAQVEAVGQNEIHVKGDEQDNAENHNGDDTKKENIIKLDGRSNELTDKKPKTRDLKSITLF